MQLTEFTLEPRNSVVSPVLALSAEPDAESPAPQDALIHEILFEPPSLDKSRKVAQEDYTILSFVIAEPHIAIRMQQALGNAYAVYGVQVCRV